MKPIYFVSCERECSYVLCCLLQIVNLIEETGHFHITNTTFDFDLCSLDRGTVRKLQSYLETSGLPWGSADCRIHISTRTRDRLFVSFPFILTLKCFFSLNLSTLVDPGDACSACQNGLSLPKKHGCQRQAGLSSAQLMRISLCKHYFIYRKEVEPGNFHCECADCLLFWFVCWLWQICG